MKEETIEIVKTQLAYINKESNRLTVKLEELYNINPIERLTKQLGKYYIDNSCSNVGFNYHRTNLIRIDKINAHNSGFLHTTVDVLINIINPLLNNLSIIHGTDFDTTADIDNTQYTEILKEEFDTLYQFALEELNKRSNETL